MDTTQKIKRAVREFADGWTSLIKGQAQLISKMERASSGASKKVYAEARQALDVLRSSVKTYVRGGLKQKSLEDVERYLANNSFTLSDQLSMINRILREA